MFICAAILSSTVFAALGGAQTLMPGVYFWGTPPLPPSDLAVLELQERRDDLACEVSVIKPELGFDFMFQTGYEVEIPMRELVGHGNELTILFRVFPQGQSNDPTYMVQKVRVPSIEQSTRGTGTIQGSFSVGEGQYHIDWLMRDIEGRICASFWNVEAKLGLKDRQLREWVPSALAQPIGPPFAEEPPVLRPPQRDSMHVSIIVDFTPFHTSYARMPERDLKGLLAILRRIVRDPRIGRCSISAGSLETKQVVYRQENVSRIDFPSLGEALGELKFGMVDIKQMASAGTPGQFAVDVINESCRQHKPDALIVLGCGAHWERSISQGLLDSVENLGIPFFYFIYNPELEASSWGDPISKIVKRMHGSEYIISRPKDLFTSWSQVMFRITQAKRGPQWTTAGGKTK